LSYGPTCPGRAHPQRMSRPGDAAVVRGDPFTPGYGGVERIRTSEPVLPD